ncbi:hypothetical protein B296_00027120 [Ensete ventricosum]|uniref:Uncharacterized protein n=1 Tax=Ensete ventricosum TaxID=4639 RepID=A0A426YEE0_ENSVE|nr:hypothetical protein B296_00027120 [Ensete ventricosum]
MEEELVRTFDLTFVVTSGVAESYGEPADVVVWDEDIERYAVLMAHGGGVEWRNVWTSSGSLGNQSGPESSSSSVSARADAKALQALEAMKSHHDFDSTHDAWQSSNWRGVSRSCALGPGFNIATSVAPCAANPWDAGLAKRGSFGQYIRGTLIPRLASDLYTLPSEVLMDGATKVIELDLKEGGDPNTVAATEVRAYEV